MPHIYAYYDMNTQVCLYIGSTKYDDTTRHTKHIYDSKIDTTKSFYKYVRQCGWNNIERRVVFEIDDPLKLKMFECDAVKKYRPQFNMRKPILTEEERQCRAWYFDMQCKTANEEFECVKAMSC